MDAFRLLGRIHNQVRPYLLTVVSDSSLGLTINSPLFRNITIPLPKETRKNGTLHMYAFAAPMPRSPDETRNWDRSLNNPKTMMAYFELTQYLVPEAATFNLLKDKDEPTQKKVRFVLGVKITGMHHFVLGRKKQR